MINEFDFKNMLTGTERISHLCINHCVYGLDYGTKVAGKSGKGETLQSLINECK